jgi:hypothetical protein
MEIGVAVSEEKDPFIRQSFRGHDGKEASNSNSVDVDSQHLRFVVYTVRITVYFFSLKAYPYEESYKKVNDERAF